MTTTIICPHCKKQVEITEALTLQIEAQVKSKVDEKHQKELEEARKTASDESARKLTVQYEFEMKKIKRELEENEEKNKTKNDQIEELFKTIRQLKSEKDDIKIEMEKRLALEEDKIRLEAQKKAEEEQFLKIKEKDKQLADTLKELEDAKRKLQQGSQQNQGEVFELEFENMLTREFPNDKIIEVAKGTRGGDIVQEVWDRNGNFCGKILWELKNTKTWSEQWVDKLKGDQREATAECAVLISEAVPNDLDSAKFYKNIWVTKRQFVIGLAYALRFNIIQLSIARKGNEGIKEKKDVMYQYLSSTEFRLRVDAIVEAFTNMQTEVEKERRYFANKWARDEKNIRQVIDNTIGMYGDLKGIMGNSLPQIKGLEFENSLQDSLLTLSDGEKS